MSDAPAVWSRRALLAVAILLCLIPLLPVLGLGEPIGASAQTGRDRPPEVPPGWAFGIWGPIFGLFAAFAWLSATQSTYLVHRLRRPLLLAGLAGAAWMLCRQFGTGAAPAFPFLLAMTLASLVAAARFDAMRGLGGSPDKALADLLTGLMSGWLTVAVAVSVPGLLRPVLALGPSDAVWPLLGLSLATLFVLGRGSRWLVTASVWYRVAIGWGVLGMVANLWMATDLHLPAVATAVVGVWIVLAPQASPAPGAARRWAARGTAGS